MKDRVVVWQQWDRDGRVIRRLYDDPPRAAAAPTAAPAAEAPRRVRRGVAPATQPDLL